MAKKLNDTNRQLVDCMQKIKSLATDEELRQRELEELKNAAQVIVDMVDPPEEGVAETRSLLERLCGAPQKISGYITRTTRTFVQHVLRLIKSFYPQANVSPLADGMAADYSEEKFVEYLEEVEPVAHKIVENLEQDQEHM